SSDICCLIVSGSASFYFYSLSLHDALPIFFLCLQHIGDRQRAQHRSEDGTGSRDQFPIWFYLLKPWHRVLSCFLTLYGNYVYLKDRKSTRLNSSHVAISYAVFCLKKKK